MFKDCLLITRPYSLVDLALVGLLANIIAVGQIIPNMWLFLDILIPLMFWIAFLYLTENRKKRIHVPVPLSIAFLLIPVVLIFLINPLSLVFLPFALVVLYLYSQKNSNKYLGMFSFLSRGLFTVLAFLTIISLHGFNLLDPTINSYTPLLIGIFLLSSSRNLVGDIRDYGVDRHTFTTHFGKLPSLAVSSLMLLLVILLFLDPILTFPLYILLLIMVLTRNNAFNLHKLYVLTTTFFFMNYLLNILGISPAFSDVLYLSVVLNFTYNYVPRSYAN
jgi:hypothetical protein